MPDPWDLDNIAKRAKEARRRDPLSADVPKVKIAIIIGLAGFLGYLLLSNLLYKPAINNAPSYYQNSDGWRILKTSP